MITWTPTGRDLRVYHVETSLGAWYTRNRGFTHPATEPNSPGPNMSELPKKLPAPQMERSVLPPRVPPVHAVTPRTSSTWLQWWAWPPQRLIEEMPLPGIYISKLWGLYTLYGLYTLAKATVYWCKYHLCIHRYCNRAHCLFFVREGDVAW